VPWSILHRYVLVELLRVFLLALAAITGILVMVGVVAEASQQGFGPGQIIKLIPFMIPGTLPFTVPATTLFAVSVVYGRLSHDNEITAIKAAGIPVTKVIWPALWIGMLLSSGVFVLYEEFIPRAYHQMKTTALHNIEELIYMRLRRDLCFNEPKVNYQIAVQAVQGRRLIGATFKRRDNLGQFDMIAVADEAEIEVDLNERLVKIHMRHAEIIKDDTKNAIYLDRETIPVALPPIGAARQARPKELSKAQLQQQRHKLLLEEEAIRAELARRAAGAAEPPPVPLAPPRNGGPPEQVIHQEVPLPSLPTPDLQAKLVLTRQAVWQLDTEEAWRPALALGSLFFALVGCPVGIWFHKRDYLSAFVTCFLPIVLVYYPLMMFGFNLGKEGQVDPTYSMWVGNAVLGAVGLLLLYRLVRR
jgi:lipopolysaccharide export system permease protein